VFRKVGFGEGTWGIRAVDVCGGRWLNQERDMRCDRQEMGGAGGAGVVYLRRCAEPKLSEWQGSGETFGSR
jgi:hypothetical protein